MAEQQEILLDNAFVTDKGNWQQGATYETNDIVHTQDGIFLSLVDNNATQPSASADGWKVWLDKATRVGLMNSTTIAKAAGQYETTLWLGDIELVVDCDKAIQLLSALEIYSLECFNVTSSHKAAVNKLDNIDAVLTYDYREGYPEKLKMEV